MAKFLNTATNEFIETEDAEDEALFKEAEAAGFQAVTDVVDTTTGEQHTIPHKELGIALDSKRFVIPQVWQAQKGMEQIKQDEMGPIQSAAYGFAKSATMGAAPAVGGIVSKAQGKDYGAGRKEYEQAQEQAYEKFPATYGLGYAAGVVPGLAARGLTAAGQVAAGAVAPLVGEAAKVDEPITPERGASLATDVVTGGLLGGIGAGIGQKVPQTGQAIGEMAERRAVKAVGADVLKPQRKIERMPGGRQAFGRELLDQGIVTAGKSIPEMGSKAKEVARMSGERVGNAMRSFDAQIGTPSVSKQQLVAEIEAIPQELRRNPATAGLADRIENSFVKHMRDWAGEGGNATLEDVWKIRSELDNVAYTETGLDKAINKQLQKVRRVLEDRMEKTALSAGVKPEQMGDYKRAKRIYQVAQQAAETATEKQNRLQANRSVSLTDYLSGGALAGAGATIAGTPGGIAGAVLGAMGNKLLRERGPQVQAVTMAKISDMMKTNPEAFKALLNTFVRTGAIELGE